MAPAVVFRPEAAGEATEIRDWYEERRAGLGQDFSAELAAAVLRIAENPEAYRRARGETRRAVLRRFPYAIYFRAESDTIVVLAVHGRQHPSRWQRRT